MYTDINNMITGYQFFFEKEEKENIPEEEWKIKNLRVDYLADGEFVISEDFGAVDKQTVEKIQQKLNEGIMVNLNVFDNWTENKKISNRNKTLGIFNMYKMEVLEKNNVRITFIKSGYKTGETVITGVTEEKKERIKELLSETSKHNLTCTRQCDAVTWLDVLAII